MSVFFQTKTGETLERQDPTLKGIVISKIKLTTYISYINFSRMFATDLKPHY